MHGLPFLPLSPSTNPGHRTRTTSQDTGYRARTQYSGTTTRTQDSEYWIRIQDPSPTPRTRTQDQDWDPGLRTTTRTQDPGSLIQGPGPRTKTQDSGQKSRTQDHLVSFYLKRCYRSRVPSSFISLQILMVLRILQRF
jgi:hypothetical protein